MANKLETVAERNEAMHWWWELDIELQRQLVQKYFNGKYDDDTPITDADLKTDGNLYLTAYKREVVDLAK